MTSVALGIDLGGTNCRGGLVDSSGCLLFRAEMETGAGVDFFPRFESFCHKVLTQATAAGLMLTHIGLGVPGVVDGLGRILGAPNLPALHGVDLRQRLHGRFGFSVHVGNDVDAIAAGEARCGAGRGIDDFLVIALGTGVGGGLVLRRQVWRGSIASTAEIGHVIVVDGGRLGGCGHRGCLETYASGPGLAHSIELARLGGEASHFKFPAIVTGPIVAAAAHAGDPVALAAFAEAGRHLGTVIASVLNLLGLSTVIFAGSGVANLDLMRSTILRSCSDALFPGTPLPQLLPAALGDDAGIIGAALGAPGDDGLL
ncbi:MAG: ROK family protein [Candidatus Zixiibacteriota bacterium]|nr:MAG: ROK family protein [candidate division Zixibacteria bacterium]